MPETFAHTVTLRRDAAGRWIVSHSWLVAGCRRTDWRNTTRAFPCRDRDKAEAHAMRLRKAHVRVERPSSPEPAPEPILPA